MKINKHIDLIKDSKLVSIIGYCATKDMLHLEEDTVDDAFHRVVNWNKRPSVLPKEISTYDFWSTLYTQLIKHGYNVTYDEVIDSIIGEVTEVKAYGVFGVIPNDNIRIILQANPKADEKVEVQDPYHLTLRSAIMELDWFYPHDYLKDANIDASTFYSYVYEHADEVLDKILFWNTVKKECKPTNVKELAKKLAEEEEIPIDGLLPGDVSEFERAKSFEEKPKGKIKDHKKLLL